MNTLQIEEAALTFLRHRGFLDADSVGIEDTDNAGRYLCSYNLGGLLATGEPMVAVDPESGTCRWSRRRIVNLL